MTSWIPPCSLTLRRTTGVFSRTCMILGALRRSSMVSNRGMTGRGEFSTAWLSLNTPAYLASRYTPSISATDRVMLRIKPPNASLSRVRCVSAINWNRPKVMADCLSAREKCGS